MKYAVVDMGSNSIRLVIYETQENSFRIILKQKIIAGLAGYINNGYLTEDGIECAYNSLLEFKETIDSFSITNILVFATASLRNIKNSKEATDKISAATGYKVDTITGEQEALLGHVGATYSCKDDNATVVDIGGASTEITYLNNEKMLVGLSFPIGSLKLYNENVKKTLPGKGTIERINEQINIEISSENIDCSLDKEQIVCVGGTARAILKIARNLFSLPEYCNVISIENFEEICDYILACKKKSFALILKTDPERIHTLIPGLLILKHIIKIFNPKEIIISKYGVREGYLCKHVLEKKQESMNTLKTEN